MEIKVVFFDLKSSYISYLALHGSFEYLCYGSTVILIVLLFQCVDQHQTSESEGYRRLILTSEVDPRTVTVPP